MDPERLAEIEEWYDQQKELVEKAFLEKARKNPLDRQAKQQYQQVMKTLHKKYAALSIKEINNRHLLKKHMDQIHKDLLRLMDKVTEIYKE